jgi:hypothetical protein
MRRLLMLSLVLAGTVSGFLSPAPVTAQDCILYCTTPDACGYSCCYRECCGKTCVFLACPPPLDCENNN